MTSWLFYNDMRFRVKLLVKSCFSLAVSTIFLQWREEPQKEIIIHFWSVAECVADCTLSYCFIYPKFAAFTGKSINQV